LSIIIVTIEFQILHSASMKNFQQMNNVFKKLILSIFACCILSCKKDVPTVETTTTTPFVDITIPNIIPKGTEKYLSKNSDYVFDQGQVKTYNLLMRVDDLLKLNNDPAKEEYLPAALVFEGDTISPIGVRYKGSIGQYVGCLSGTDWSKPSGYKTCTKLSMQFKINWEGRKEKFYDLNKLQFHSQNYDKSQLRERLGYWLFNQMGVPAPRCVNARLLINGKLSGLYGLVEEIDNRFAEYAYAQGKGNIYKEVWPILSNGLAQKDQAFIEALKTNESPNADVSLMKAFSEAISTSIEANRKGVITQYMDIKSIMSYIVVDRGIRHDDGPFHWYCDNGGGCGNHNYYWFEDQKNKKMHLIPWDLDGAFEHIIRNSNPVTPLADKWGDVSNDCKPFNYGTASFLQKSAACDKLTAAWVTFNEEYLIAKKHFQTDILTNEKTITQFDLWAKQISPFIKEADEYHNAGISIEANKKTTTFSVWENAVETLKNQVQVAKTLERY
jgi:spore coat protein CotH